MGFWVGKIGNGLITFLTAENGYYQVARAHGIRSGELRPCKALPAVWDVVSLAILAQQRGWNT